MRFLFFAAQYLPTVGGVERYTHSLAHTLVEQGHAATVVTSALPGLPAEENDGGVQVVRLPAHLLMKGRFPVVKLNAAFRRAAAKLWAQRFDFAVINSHFYLLSVWATGQCKKHGVPALLLEHVTGHLSLGSPLLDVFGNLYEHACMALVKRRVPRVYGVARACCDWLTHFHVQAAGVLYNSVNPAALQALAQEAGRDFRSEYGLAPGTKLVAFSGRLIPEKGALRTAEAFQRLSAAMPGLALLVAGDGPEREALERAAIPSVFCTGPLSYAHNIALLAQADVFCLPTSYAEGFPTAVLEAAALGTCVITTPAGGSPELVLDGETGLLLSQPTPEHIYRALEKALANDAWRKGAGERAKQEVQARFTWSRTAQRLVEIANEVAAE